MKTLSSHTPITLLPNTQRNSNKLCPDLLRMEELGWGVGSTRTCRQKEADVGYKYGSTQNK